MLRLEQWANFPTKLRQHLVQRMADRSITIADLNQLRLWVESNPEVPDGEWYKDFGSFKVCAETDHTQRHFSLPANQLEENAYNSVPLLKETNPPSIAHNTRCSGKNSEGPCHFNR